jgi:hypothetical protein
MYLPLNQTHKCWRVSNFVGSPDRFTTERTENTEKTLLKISVSSVFSVVSKCLAHLFGHSQVLKGKSRSMAFLL